MVYVDQNKRLKTIISLNKMKYQKYYHFETWMKVFQGLCWVNIKKFEMGFFFHCVLKGFFIPLDRYVILKR